MDAPVFARNHIEPDMIAVMDHHPVGADIDPIRVEVPRHDRAAGTDIAPAIQLVPERRRKRQDVDVSALLNVFENRSVFDADGRVFGCLRFPDARFAA